MSISFYKSKPYISFSAFLASYNSAGCFLPVSSLSLFPLFQGLNTQKVEEKQKRENRAFGEQKRPSLVTHNENT